MKKIVALLTISALVSCNKKEDKITQTEDPKPIETTEKQETKTTVQLREMSPEQISEVFTSKKNDTLYVTNFFATWCRPCMEEMPYFQEKMKELKNEKVKFTFINIDEPKKWTTKVADFAEESGLGNDIILLNYENTSEDFFSKNFKTWRGDVIPFTMIYKNDRKEEIIGSMSKEKLTELINSFK